MSVTRMSGSYGNRMLSAEEAARAPADATSRRKAAENRGAALENDPAERDEE